MNGAGGPGGVSGADAGGPGTVSVEGKRAAGEAAAELAEDGMLLGLGTGSTVAYFLDALAARGREVAGVPTSEATAARCRELGIPLLEPGEVEHLDLCVDGADELDHELNLTKGGGGALLREKVVATMARRFVVIATTDKLVDRLGDSFALPIEVVPFALRPVLRWLAEMGFSSTIRGAPEEPYRTDNGNAIIDARLAGGLDDPAALDVRVGLVPGVVETGLFIGLAESAFLGGQDGTVTLVTPAGASRAR